jgi:hypothetical protein
VQRYLLITEEECLQNTSLTKTGTSTSSLTTSAKTEFHGGEYFGKYGADLKTTNALHVVIDLSSLILTIAHTTLSLLGSHMDLTWGHMIVVALKLLDSAPRLRMMDVVQSPIDLDILKMTPLKPSSWRSTENYLGNRLSYQVRNYETPKIIKQKQGMRIMKIKSQLASLMLLRSSLNEEK